MCEAHFEKQPVRKYITVLNISDWAPDEKASPMQPWTVTTHIDLK